MQVHRLHSPTHGATAAHRIGRPISHKCAADAAANTHAPVSWQVAAGVILPARGMHEVHARKRVGQEAHVALTGAAAAGSTGACPSRPWSSTL